MPFELRIGQTTVATFETADEAIARAREIVRSDADKQPEVVDTTTGKAVAPAASRASRDDLARKIGY
jgi:hypothetical protein